MASNLYYQQQRFIVFRRTQLNREAFPPFFFPFFSLEKMKYTASGDGGGEKKKKLMVPFFFWEGLSGKKSREEELTDDDPRL